MVNSSHILSSTPSWCPSPTLAWTFSHGMQLFMNFSNTGPSNRVPFSNNCPRVGPFWQRSPSRVDCSSESPRWATIPVRNLSLVWSSRVYQPAPVWALHGCRWISASPLSSVGYREAACITSVFTGCRGISAPAPGAPPPPLSSPILTPAGLFISHSHSSLPSLLHSLSYPFFKMLSQLHYKHQ